MKRVLLCLVFCLIVSLGTALGETLSSVPVSDGFYFSRTESGWQLFHSDGSLVMTYAWPDEAFWDASGSPPLTGFDEQGYGIMRGNQNPARYGIIDRAGNIICYADYLEIKPLSEELFCVRGDSGFGYINSSGEVVIPLTLDWADSFSDGLAVAQQDGHFVILNSAGQLLTRPGDLFSVEDFSPDGLARVWLTDPPLCGVINTSGKVVIPFRYNFIGEFVQGIASFRVDTGAGLMDTSGNHLLEPIYDNVTVHESDGTIRTLLNGEERYLTLKDGKPVPIATVDASLDLTQYRPNEGNDRVATLSSAPTLTLSEPLPRLDGATALFPVYSAVVQAVYPDWVRYEEPETAENPVMTFTNTPGAYQRLIDGECDVIFVAAPSESQLADAAAKDVEFQLTPIIHEAFVFFVHRDNPLEAVTVDQIRQIYSGAMTDWADLGVEDLGPVIAYQRNENSGSQTTLQKLMGDTPLMTPPQEVDMDDFSMSAIVNTVAYRNLPNAIGFSFRFFLTEMMGSDVRLLAIDGVSPTIENIQNGSYPLTSTVYAVSRKGDENPNLQALLDWLRSDQGREIIEKSGYTPAP